MDTHVSSVERLASTHPDLEIWWDSSPLVYKQWTQKMLNAAEPGKRPILEEQFARLYNTGNPAASVFRGCTTNPPLSLQAVKADPKFWDGWIDDLILSRPNLSIKEFTWLTYKEVVKRGAQLYMPIY
jgi:transaldolase